MIISTKHGYAMIANQRVGSEAMHLIAGADADLAFSRIGNDKHMTPDQLVERLEPHGLSDICNDLLVYAIVREPAEWYVSWFNSRSRSGLSNPKHRNHKNYTGNVNFDEYLEAAKSEPRPAMTKSRPQSAFFKSSHGLEVRPVPFDLINNVYPEMLPSDSLMSGFRIGNPDHKKNSAKDVRIQRRDLTEDQVRTINEGLFSKDYELYQKAKRDAPGYRVSPAVQGTAAGSSLERRIQTEPALSELAFETAYTQAQSLLYGGMEETTVRGRLSAYETVDLDALFEDVSKRVARFKA